MMPMAWSAAPCRKEEKENHSQYRVRDEKDGKGKVTFVQGNFFDDTWLKEIGVPRNGFDIIYYYTVCILNAAVGLIPSLLFFSPLVLCILQGDLQDASLSVFGLLMCHFRPALDPSGLSGLSF